MDNRDILEAQLMSKSVGLAALLTFFFGGFGLLYVSIINGIVGAIIELVLVAVTGITFGMGAILLVPWHIICIIVAMSMANAHNKRLLNKLAAKDAAASIDNNGNS